MAIRTFIFCDICNTKGIRMVEERRNPERDRNMGRRISDGRSWFEGTVEESLAVGWKLTEEGQHVCDRCAKRGLAGEPS